MMEFLRKYKVHVLSGLLAFFLIYIALGFGSSFFVKGSPNDSIAEVDGEKILLRQYWSHYQRALDQVKAGTLDENARKQKRDEALRDMIQNMVFKREAAKMGIIVPDQQVVASLAQIPAFQSNGRFDPQLYIRALQSQLRSTPQDFEEEQRVSIAFFKLRWLIQSCVKVTDREAAMAYAFQGAEFAKANEWITDDKGKKIRRASGEDLRAAFSKRLWDEKVMWCFNQWFNQIGQKLRVKTHLDILDAGGMR